MFTSGQKLRVYEHFRQKIFSFRILDALELKFWGTLRKIFPPSEERYHLNKQKINNSDIFSTIQDK